MKIVANFLNTKTQNNKQKVSFNAGLTREMTREINSIDVKKVSERLAEIGVPTDFKDNKVIAWCCARTIGIKQQLNERFGQKLSLPIQIHVTDFRKLNVDNPDAMYGFCNMARCELIRGSNEIISSRVLFFNSLHNWNNIDSISDSRYSRGLSASDFFLDIFFHDFGHVDHEDHLFDKYDDEILLAKLQKVLNPEQILQYQTKHGSQVSRICKYAKVSPLEAIACDLASRMVNSIDRNKLNLIRNPLAGIPYQEDLSFFQILQIKTEPLNRLLRNFWNGNFE